MKTELETIRDRLDTALEKEKLYFNVIYDLVQLGRHFEWHKTHAFPNRIITTTEAQRLTERAAELNARSAAIKARMEAIADRKVPGTGTVEGPI